MASSSGRSHRRYKPLGSSPLVALNGAQFLQKFRLSKSAVNIVLGMLQNTLLDGGDVPLHLQLLTALRYYATGRLVRAAAVARLPKEKTRALVSHVSSTIVKELWERHLDFPDTQQRDINKTQFQEIGHLVDIIGCVSSTCVPLVGSLGKEAGVGNQQYGQNCLTLLVVCGPQGQINSLMVQPYVANAWQVFQGSRLHEALRSGAFDGSLLTDLNFPPNSSFLVPIAELRNWTDELYNLAHYATMEIARHALELMKARFPCLIRGMDLLHPCNLNAVVACGVLHNFSLNHAVPFPRYDPTLHHPRPNPLLQVRSLPTQDREE